MPYLLVHFTGGEMNLRQWLQKKPVGLWGYIKHIIAMTTIGLGYTVVIGAINALAATPILPDWLHMNDKPPLLQLLFMLVLFIGAIPNAIAEELIFRAPISAIVRKWPKNGKATIVGIAILSAIFGFIHGGQHSLIGGLVTVLSHGPMGILLSLSYLKCGGREGKFWKPIGVTIAIHTLINMILVGTVIIGMLVG